MGWTYPHDVKDKKAIIYECTFNDCFNTCLKSACYGRELWTLWHDIENDRKHIILFLLVMQDGSYGYKDIPESMGPYYFKCPLSYLKIAPVTNQSWRDSVIEYHAEKKRSLK